MLVSTGLKILVAHPGRTAGTAVSAALRPWLDPPEDALYSSIKENGWQPSWHALGPITAAYEDIRKPVEDKLEEGYRILTTARNPWERMVSAWTSKGAWNIKSPADFVQMIVSNSNKNRTYIAMMQPVVAAAGPDPWFVLLHEDLKNNWKALCDVLDIEADLSYLECVDSKRSTSQTEAFQEFFSDRSLIDKVAAFYKSDLDVFGYEFPDHLMLAGTTPIEEEEPEDPFDIMDDDGNW